MKTNKFLFGIFLSAGFLFSCGNGGEKKSVSKAIGQETYEKQCVRCHGDDGNLGLSGAKSLSKTNLSSAEMIPIITNGSSGGIMPSYRDILSDDEIKNVAQYIETRLKK